MRTLVWAIIFCFLAGTLYNYYFGDQPSAARPAVAAAAATAATVAPSVAAAAPSTGAAVATGAAVGAGFFATVLAGGWFLGEMSLFLWFVVFAIVAVPLGGMAWLSELPDDEESLKGSRILGSLALFATMMFLLDWGGIPLWHAVITHGWYVTAGLCGFLAIGVVWSHYKYGLFAQDRKAEITDLIEVFCQVNDLKASEVLTEVNGKMTFTLQRDYEKKWTEYFRNATDKTGRWRRVGLSGATAESPVVTFRKNKARITLWILFWPTSVLRGLLKDVLARAIDWLVESMKQMYEAIARRHAIEMVYAEKKPAATASAPKV